jgi:hypothetical protein
LNSVEENFTVFEQHSATCGAIRVISGLSGGRRKSWSLNMRDVHIKHFDDKFQYLFSHHPAIKNYAALAKALEVAPALVSGWKNGTQSTHPERIPIRHIGSVCDHLFVLQEILELEDLQQFKARAAERPRPSLWDALVLSAPLSPRLRIAGGPKSSETNVIPLLTTRGIHDPDDIDVDVPVFSVGDAVMIRFDAEPGWHVALFCKDRAGWQRLHPKPKWPETHTDGLFYYPQPHAPGRLRAATLDGVPGAQLLVGLMTKEPLPDPVRRAIIDGSDLPAALQRLAVHLKTAKTPTSEVVQLRYHVEP